MKLKSFTKYDWYAFNGAEPFAYGSEPLIGSTGDRSVIVDANGIEVIFADESTYNFQTSDAKAVAQMLLLDTATPEQLIAIGFDRIN